VFLFAAQVAEQKQDRARAMDLYEQAIAAGSMAGAESGMQETLLRAYLGLAGLQPLDTDGHGVAIELLQRAKQQVPAAQNDVRVMMLLAEKLFSRDAAGDRELANAELRELDRAIKDDRVPPNLRTALRLRLAIARGRGIAAADPLQAAKILQAALDHSETRSDSDGSNRFLIGKTWEILAGIHWQLGNLERAGQCFLQAGAIDGEASPDRSLQAAMALVNTGSGDAAEAILRRALQEAKDPQQLQELYTRFAQIVIVNRQASNPLRPDLTDARTAVAALGDGAPSPLPGELVARRAVLEAEIANAERLAAQRRGETTDAWDQAVLAALDSALQGFVDPMQAPPNLLRAHAIAHAIDAPELAERSAAAFEQAVGADGLDSASMRLSLLWRQGNIKAANTFVEQHYSGEHALNSESDRIRLALQWIRLLLYDQTPAEVDGKKVVAQATAWMQRLAQDHDRSLEVARERTLIAIQLNDSSELAASIAMLKQLEPDGFLYHVAEAQAQMLALEKSGGSPGKEPQPSLTTIQQHLDEAGELVPNALLLQRLLGRFERRRGNLRKSVEIFSQLWDRGQRDPRLAMELIRGLAKLGDDEAAGLVYQQSMTQNLIVASPLLIEPTLDLLSRSALRVDTGNLLEIARKGYETEPSIENLENYAYMAFIDAWKTSASEEPKDREGVQTKAKLAEDLLLQVKQESPQDAETLSNLITLYDFVLKDKPRGSALLAELDKSIGENGSNAVLQRALTLSPLYWQRGEREKAARIYEAAIEELLLRRMGTPEEARAILFGAADFFAADFPVLAVALYRELLDRDNPSDDADNSADDATIRTARNRLIDTLLARGAPSDFAEMSRELEQVNRESLAPGTRESRLDKLRRGKFARLQAAYLRSQGNESAARAERATLQDLIRQLKAENIAELTALENVEYALMLEQSGAISDGWERLMRVVNAVEMNDKQIRMAVYMAAADFWIRNFRDKQQFLPDIRRLTTLLDQLEQPPNPSAVALRFRLDQTPVPTAEQPFTPEQVDQVSGIVKDFLPTTTEDLTAAVDRAERAIMAAARTKRPEILRTVLDTVAAKHSDKGLPLIAQASAQAASNLQLTDDAIAMLEPYWQSAVDQIFASGDVRTNRGLLNLIGEVSYLKSGTNRRSLTELSQRVWERILADNPTDPTALNNLSIILADQIIPADRILTDKADEFERSLVGLGEAASRMPNDPDLADSKGLVLALNGQAAKAVLHLQQAQALGATGIATKLHLAYALARAGNKAEAQQLWDYIKRLGIDQESLLVPIDRKLFQQLKLMLEPAAVTARSASHPLTDATTPCLV
jgi:hypothetical protein